MARAPLLRLQYEVDSGVLRCHTYLFRLVPDDGVDVIRGHEPQGGANNMLQQGLSANFMQHFRKPGFEPRPLARSHNGYCNTMGSSRMLFSGIR